MVNTNLLITEKNPSPSPVKRVIKCEKNNIPHTNYFRLINDKKKKPVTLGTAVSSLIS